MRVRGRGLTAPPALFYVLLPLLLAVLPVHAEPAYLAELTARARAEGLARHPEWRRLLHHRWTLTGRTSEVAPGPFFLSSRGRKDPEAELEATLAAFFEAAPEPDKSAACRFPARRAWLKERLDFDRSRLPEPACPLYAQWRATLAADSLSLVFADSYLNNPSSMYGHTFLLLHKQGRRGLLDYAVNFAADADTANGILFAVYGLAGLFPGKFSVMPYYLKVQEYNNFESRDLWEYRLSLSSAAMDRLLGHLWELEGTTFAYYFFNKNCSYQLMPLLDAAVPELRSADRWPLYVIPIDTVRLARSLPGLASEASYRPSHVTRMLRARSRLSAEEARAAARLAREDRAEEALPALAPERKALILDAASRYLEYRIDYRRDADPRLAKRQHALHLSLSRLGVAVPPPEPPAPAPPDRGHKSSRLGLGFGFLDGTAFQEVSVRPGLHDPLDPAEGYIPLSALEMMQIRLRRREKPAKVYLESFDFVRILSLTPLDEWIRKPSWQVDGGLRQAVELGGRPWDSAYFGLTLGSGVSARLPRLPAAVYALAQADGGGGAVFEDDHRLGPGGTAGLLVGAGRRLRLGFEASYWHYYLGDGRSRGRLRAEADYTLGRDWAARARFTRHGPADEARFELHRYF